MTTRRNIMGWIKLALMSAAGIFIILFVAFSAVLTVLVFIAIIATVLIVILSWKITNVVGINERSSFFMPFFIFNLFLITAICFSLFYRIFW